MKKRIIEVVLMATMAFAASWGISQNKNEVSLSDLILSNVEALANNEEEITTPTDCPGGTILCAWIKGPGESVTYYKRK
ncbi:hypothetical protein D0T51_10230 [Parabacteroides sp. 52]|uniref:NVEALA domain-containing protein n=1 Tax=unclassified Parabacteroides TaxID=2649774 RepID=UPI0013D28B88|nr:MULTISPECIES: NVEALA domain-containing protein [unclassified Parabacteroides]MDH6534690.1 hypothetical protein [Parabacteroides sp. PM5-20]NDV56102.1 hypothetical protein [Parabacteroides sp. 52]